mgnify:CR=1 FL=1
MLSRSSYSAVHLIITLPQILSACAFLKIGKDIAMAVYIVGQINITDAEMFKSYSEKVAPTVH